MRKRTNLKQYIKERIRFITIRNNGGWEHIGINIKPSVTIDGMNYRGILNDVISIETMTIEEYEKRKAKKDRIR